MDADSVSFPDGEDISGVMQPVADRAVEGSVKQSQATFEIIDDAGQLVAKVPFSG